jgi:hypothetical protein
MIYRFVLDGPMPVATITVQGNAGAPTVAIAWANQAGHNVTAHITGAAPNFDIAFNFV